MYGSGICSKALSSPTHSSELAWVTRQLYFSSAFMFPPFCPPMRVVQPVLDDRPFRRAEFARALRFLHNCLEIGQRVQAHLRRLKILARFREIVGGDRQAVLDQRARRS